MDDLEIRQRKKKMRKIIIETIKNADIISVNATAEIQEVPGLMKHKMLTGVKELSIRYRTK